MEYPETVRSFQAGLPGRPFTSVEKVYSSMGDVRSKLGEVGLEPYQPFLFVYQSVTGEVQDRLEISQAYRGVQLFREPAILNRATGIFWHHGVKQLVTPEEHWKPYLEDERASKVDPGTQLWLGMIAHIGGDLARTVHEVEANENYIKHDYPLVNNLLTTTAHRVSQHFIPLENIKLRAAITEAAMIGIKAGRWNALRDYRKLEAARTEEQRDYIISRSHSRTARVARAFLSLSYRAHENNIISFSEYKRDVFGAAA